MPLKTTKVSWESNQVTCTEAKLNSNLMSSHSETPKFLLLSTLRRCLPPKKMPKQHTQKNMNLPKLFSQTGAKNLFNPTYCRWKKSCQPVVEVVGLSHDLQGFIHPRWLFGISEPSLVSHKGAPTNPCCPGFTETVFSKELGILILLLHRLPVVPTIRLPSNSQKKLRWKTGGPPMVDAPPKWHQKVGKWQGKLGNESSSKEARFKKDHWTPTFLSVLDALTAH